MLSVLPLAFLGMGVMELLVVAVVALLVFGGELPDVMRSMGRAYARFRESLSEIAKPVREEFRDVPALPSARDTLRDITRDVASAGKKKTPAESPEYDAATDGATPEGASKQAATPPPPTVDEIDDEPPPV